MSLCFFTLYLVLDASSSPSLILPSSILYSLWFYPGSFSASNYANMLAILSTWDNLFNTLIMPTHITISPAEMFSVQVHRAKISYWNFSSCHDKLFLGMSFNSKLVLKKIVISNFTVIFANIFMPRSIPI